MTDKSAVTYNSIFWLHLFITIFAWAMPFCINWSLTCFIFALVQVQFYIFGKCLMNADHGLEEKNSATFYSFMLESLGFHPNRKVLKFFVRNVLYIALGSMAVFYQVYLGYAPILF